MIFLTIIFTALLAAAQEPVHWTHVLQVSDKHEFYKNRETIVKPKDSWQTLFALVYVDRDLKRLKDCVFFRVPGSDPGVLKLKTISGLDVCENHLLSPGDREIGDIKSLQFDVSEKELKLDFTRPDFRPVQWRASLQTALTKPEAGIHLSSAEFKSPKIIFLAQKSNVKAGGENKSLKVNALCHDVNEDCEEVSPSICSQCPMGWYEIPNGCPQGPKYCGVLECGQKHRPACRRGMMWQRSGDEFDCRTNASFAYCAKGLSVQCEGRKAFCR